MYRSHRTDGKGVRPVRQRRPARRRGASRGSSGRPSARLRAALHGARRQDEVDRGQSSGQLRRRRGRGPGGDAQGLPGRAGLSRRRQRLDLALPDSRQHLLRPDAQEPPPRGGPAAGDDRPRTGPRHRSSAPARDRGGARAPGRAGARGLPPVRGRGSSRTARPARSSTCPRRPPGACSFARSGGCRRRCRLRAPFFRRRLRESLVPRPRTGARKRGPEAPRSRRRARPGMCGLRRRARRMAPALGGGALAPGGMVLARALALDPAARWPRSP